ncbi:MAG TPA: TraB/GumN family protein [Brevundimonas sp.]|nr:TraB/GumN family protein [Brevundimonas sp.]
MKPGLIALVVLLLGAAPPLGAAHAQTSLAADVSTLDEVVVRARRAGAPMWAVERGDSVVILIGSIEGVPQGYDWRPEALEVAARESQRILYPMEARASPADLLRLLWRIRTVARLPSGTTIADHVPPDLLARIERLQADERSDSWRTGSMVGLSFDLLDEIPRGQRRSGAAGVVRAAARAARVEGEPVGIVRGDELIDNLINLPPRAYLPCVEAATAAAEAGSAGAAARLDDWRSLRVPEVLANPVDVALNLCWPSGDPEMAPALRTRWAEAANVALGRPGVTLAVAPLRILAEPGGVLDQLEAQGLDPRGPVWKQGE